MINLIFTIYDQKAAAYIPPFFMHTSGMAARIFTDMVNDEQHQFSKHPEDYTLFKLGSFNDANAEIILEHTPITMHNGVTLINPSKENADEIQHEPPILSSPES